MKVLRNPTWLNVLLGALTIAVTVALAFYFNTRSNKELRVEILSNSPLVSIDTEIAKEMQVLYRDEPVRSLSVILLKFENTGNEPIEESDYSGPIRVAMSNSATVGEVSLQETRPKGIPLTPTVTRSNQIELAPVLLNPGDQAILKILALNNDSTLDISARIVGIRGLQVQSVLEQNQPFGIFLPILTVIAIVLGAMLLLFVVFWLIWQSRPVVAWRNKHFGFDAARHHYVLAQSGILMLPASKDTAQASGALARVVRDLDSCFKFDNTYLERVRNDPLFSQLLTYEPFKDVAAKHEVGNS